MKDLSISLVPSHSDNRENSGCPHLESQYEVFADESVSFMEFCYAFILVTKLRSAIE